MPPHIHYAFPKKMKIEPSQANPLLQRFAQYTQSLISNFFVLLFQSISDFLKNLPCHNEQNFALYNTENGIRTSSRRPSVYLPTVDIPSEQSMCNCVVDGVFLDKI